MAGKLLKSLNEKDLLHLHEDLQLPIIRDKIINNYKILLLKY
jgi:hypothetical protein